MLYLYLYWWTHGSNSNPGWWKHHQSMINQHLEAHPPCREASPHPWRAAPHFRVHPGNEEQSHQGLQKRPPSRLLWTPWHKMMTKVHFSNVKHGYFAKKNGSKSSFLSEIGAQTFWYALYGVTTACCVPWQIWKNTAGKSARGGLPFYDFSQNSVLFKGKLPFIAFFALGVLQPSQVVKGH